MAPQHTQTLPTSFRNARRHRCRTIEAVEKETGRKINVVIENSFTGFSDEEFDESRERITEMWDDGDEDEYELSEAKQEEESLGEDNIPENISKILKQAAETIDQATDEDRDDMINLMEDIRDAVKTKSFDAAEELSCELEDIMFYLE